MVCSEDANLKKNSVNQWVRWNLVRNENLEDKFTNTGGIYT